MWVYIIMRNKCLSLRASLIGRSLVKTFFCIVSVHVVLYLCIKPASYYIIIITINSFIFFCCSYNKLLQDSKFNNCCWNTILTICVISVFQVLKDKIVQSLSTTQHVHVILNWYSWTVNEQLLLIPKCYGWLPLYDIQYTESLYVPRYYKTNWTSWKS